MGKAEVNKLNKRNSLLSAALELFTGKGVNETSVGEISKSAGIAKGTFYLYFKDKYDIRNRLISHEAERLFTSATAELGRQALILGRHFSVEDKILFISEYIIDALTVDKKLLFFLSKNLSWGVFVEALHGENATGSVNFRDEYHHMLSEDEFEYDEPEIMLYMIVELISSTCYSSILNSQPVDIAHLKPYIFRTIKSIIGAHRISG